MSEGSSNFSLRVDQKEDVSVAVLRGKLILEKDINFIRQELREHIQSMPGKKLIVDFTGCSYFSTAALGSLMMCLREGKSRDIFMRLCGMNSEVYNVFNVTKLDTTFNIKENKEAALESFE